MKRPQSRWMMVLGTCAVMLAAAAVRADERRGPRDRPRPLARSIEGEHHGDRDRPPHREPGPKPQLEVFRLEHIPAESVMETLEQLGRSRHLREMLEQIPIACNEPSNAIVVVGPPEVMEFFERLIEGLDRPCEFHERMRAREMEFKHHEMELETEMMKRQAEIRRHMGGPPRPPAPHPARPGEPKRPGQPQMLYRPAPPRPGPRPEPERPRGPEGLGERVRAALGSPLEGLLGRLLSPEGRERLDLNREQVERLARLAGEFREKLGQLRRRVMEAIDGVPPEHRPGKAPEIVGRARREVEELTTHVKEQVGRILTPPQRERLEQLLRGGPRPPRPDERARREMEARRRAEMERRQREARQRAEEQHRAEMARRRAEEQRRAEQQRRERAERERAEREARQRGEREHPRPEAREHREPERPRRGGDREHEHREGHER